ncbi:MAG: glycine--tRNA ligase subunit beta, partial [Pseudomonadota bacterium]
AVDGFCRKNGVTREQLEEREVKGRATWFAVIDRPGQAVSDLLAAAIPAIIRDFSWPKSMRWGEASISSESLKWVRPLTGIIALLDGEVVACEVDGITSGRETVGHRFHSEGAVTIKNADDYADALAHAHVIVDHNKRAAIIREGAAAAAKAAGLTLVEDEGLVVENAGLTEWPVPLLGRFDEAFLEVPPEVIQLTARVNQKYFVCEDADGKLANAFVCTANLVSSDPDVVVDGNRKVLAARLSDARFFWDLDQKTTLAEHARKLERITFHEKLGTVADKVERVAKLARWLCEEGIVKPSRHSREGGNPAFEGSGAALDPRLRGDDVDVAKLADLAEQAARLCKADLVTEMVGEFPELQGLMGGYYAEKEGLDPQVSAAIRDHYKPVGQGDEVPTAPATVAVSLADKLDTLLSFFGADLRPTGSKDPFALRRAALAVVSLVLNNTLRGLGSAIEDYLPVMMRQESEVLDMERQQLRERQEVLKQELTIDKEAIDQHAEAERYERILRQLRQERDEYQTEYQRRTSRVEAYCDCYDDVFAFLVERLKVQQREAGVRHDLIDAVFALGGEDDLVRLLARVHALQSFIETEEGTNLLAGYKRADNILKKEGYEGDGEQISFSYKPEEDEKALIDALDAAAPKAAAAVEAEDFEGAMAALASLRSPIDRFFDNVVVNSASEEMRAARLALLARFRNAVHQVADFSRIEG